MSRVTRVMSPLHCTRSEPGRREHALCRCSHVVRTRAQVTVTRATCCTPGQGGLNTRVSSQLVTCPPHLPHVSRYRSCPVSIICPIYLFDPKLKDVCWPRSRHASITCPPPSVPYKCVCLGGDGEVTRTGTRGYNTRGNNTTLSRTRVNNTLSRTRVPGNITENTCTCSQHVAVTRAVCCHARDQDTRGSVIAV